MGGVALPPKTRGDHGPVENIPDHGAQGYSFLKNDEERVSFGKVWGVRRRGELESGGGIDQKNKEQQLFYW